MRLPQKNEKAFETTPVPKATHDWREHNEVFDQIQGVYSPWSAPVLHLKLPDQLLNNLIELTDLMAADTPELQINLQDSLAGEIDREWLIDAYMLEHTGFNAYIDKAKIVYLELHKKNYPIYDNPAIPSAHPVIVEFESKIIESKLIATWFNDMQDDEYNPQHSHDGLLSGVCYLKVPPYLPDRKQAPDKYPSPGKPKHDGSIVFTENSNNLPELCINTILISPIVGDLFIFPAGMHHQVYPFRTPDETGIRRSLAFNIGEDRGQGSADPTEFLKSILSEYDKDKILQILLEEKEQRILQLREQRKLTTDDDKKTEEEQKGKQKYDFSNQKFQ